MAKKISINILPQLKNWFIEKTSIVTEWNTTSSDDKVASEKLVKTEIDKKIDKTEVTTELAKKLDKTEAETELAKKIDKTSIKTSVTNALTNDDVVGGKAVYDEIKRVEESIPDGITHNDVTDWESATSDFQLISNLETSITNSDTKYPSSKAVQTGLDTKLNTSQKVTSVDNNSTDENVPSAKAVYDLYATIPKWQVSVVASVSELPATGVVGTIYLVKGDGKDKNNYDEYFWNDKAETPGYEKFGGVDLDISSFVTMTDVVDYLGDNGSLTLSDDGELSFNITEPTA